VLQGEIVGEGHQFRTYKSWDIETIFERVYNFYLGKASNGQYDLF
jgi:hypothetical protein